MVYFDWCGNYRIDLGCYRVLQKLGEGGFGVVYMAEQRQPVKRRVALKILKVEMDTWEIVARFEAERQALAMVEHPGIAKVFDAGATETGRLYFVMELVRGIPVTQDCDEQRLSTPPPATPFPRLRLRPSAVGVGEGWVLGCGGEEERV